MIKITNDVILLADIPRSDAVVSCQYRGGKDSCTCSYYAGDDPYSKAKVKQFMANCKKMYIDIESIHEVIKQLDSILDSYIHLFKGTMYDYKKARNYFAYKHTDIEIDKFSTTGERGYYTFNNKDDAIVAFKGLLFTKITNFEIIRDDTTYYVKIKISDNWKQEIMKVKMLKNDLISVFNNFMYTAKSQGKSEKNAAVIFGVKYCSIIKNSSIVIEELIADSKYFSPDLVKAVKFGMSISADIIWETQSNDCESNKYDILERNIYGIHIKLKNNALSLDNPHICIGWSEMGDLSSIQDKSDLSDLHENCYPSKTKNGRAQDVSQIWTFVKAMAIGDYVVYGDGKNAHIGKIVSNYYFDETNGDQHPGYVNNRKVEWLKSFAYSDLPKEFKNSLCSSRSIFSLNVYKSLILELLEKGVVDMDDGIEVTQEETVEYTKEDFLVDVFMTNEEYDSLYNLLKYKRNVILQGAPGVGKTYLAKKLAYSIIGCTSASQVEMIQFHQNYSYEDFIMGYKPNENGFELKDGVFYKFCKRAAEEPDKEFFFIVDEINRGNLSKIFGELMMLIEGDKRGKAIKLAYKDEEFFVPENVYLIGMMNTADRSLAMMDYALRRRFSFFEVEPAFKKEAFRRHLESFIHNGLIVNKVINRLSDLNDKIADENTSGLGKGFCIGHSYFCVEPVEGQSENDWYKSIIKFEICPLLDEYWWDDKSKADNCKKELLKD